MAQAAPSRSRSTTAGAQRRTGRRGRGAVRRRRWTGLGLLLLLVIGIATLLVIKLAPVGDTLREITLPLRHEDVIRQQAADKGLDPALIASVIYEESKFRDQTSHAGARGLMQITPRTAEFIAQDSGGTAFTQADLATPQVNISYGTYYLRYLLRRYDDNVPIAVAAYNAGETNVNAWIRSAGGPDAFEIPEDIPFLETRRYVEGVIKHRAQYASEYRRELGLSAR